MWNYTFSLILILTFSVAAYPQSIEPKKDFTLKGLVLERGKKIPQASVTVYVMPDRLQATTNAKGEYKVEGITTVNSTVVINSQGFIKTERNITFEDSDQINLNLYLEREQFNNTYELIVMDANLKRDQSRKALSRQEIFAMPGANGDPVKAVQNFPGINRTQGFSSQIVIQGSAPKDTAYDFEGHEIPLVFHFGGLNSVVMPEAVDQVEYFSAGYQADRSRALGGIISLRTRNPEVKERPSKWMFYLDNLSAGALYESQIDEKSSYLISGRYSYVGFFLKKALKDNEALNLTVAPEFMDLTSIYHRQISDSEEFKLSFLGSRDRLAFVFSEPVKQDPSLRGSFSNEVKFFRLVPSWKKTLDINNKLAASLAVGVDQIDVDIGSRFFNLRSDVLSTRAEWDHRLNDNWSVQTGLDSQFSVAKVKLKLPLQRNSGGVSNPISSGQTVDADVKSELINLGLYLRNEIQMSPKLKLVPGFRLDRFSQTKELFLLPRIAWNYSLSDYDLLKFGYGIYTQNPEPQESSDEVGNPEIKSPEATHVALTYEKDFREGNINGWTTSVGGFFRDFNKLIIQSSDQVVRNGQTVFEIYNNKGKGKAYGIESSLKYKKDQLSAQLSYTLSRSRRSDAVNGEYNFEYDQTHNLNLIGAYEFGGYWKVSSRYRYVTGNPETPIIGSVFDADNETYFPVRGPIYSTRSSPFSQLDLRIDKKLISDQEIWTFYLDIQNVLNTKNSEGVQYSYDYSSKQDVQGLPIIPAIGVRGEF
jgi:hypothetical protein